MYFVTIFIKKEKSYDANVWTALRSVKYDVNSDVNSSYHH